MIRLAAFAVGAILLAYTFLSYESEERQIRDRLEDFWVGLDDRGQQATQWMLRLLHLSGAAATRLLDWIYGSALISPAAVLSSAALCALPVIFANDWHRHDLRPAANTLLVVLLFAPFVRNKKLSSTTIAVALIVAGYLYYDSIDTFSLFGPVNPVNVMESVVAGFCSAIALDVTYVATTRWSLRRLVVESRLPYCLGWMALGLLVCVLGTSAFLTLAFLGGDLLDDFSWSGIGFVAFASSLIAIANASVVFFFACLIVALRCLWLLLPRIVYSAIKLKLLENRKFIAGVGTSLVALAYPPAGELLQRAVTAVLR